MTRPAVPRLRPLPAAEWTHEERDLLSGNLARADRYLSGAADAPAMPPILGLFARHPRVGAGWLASGATLLELTLTVGSYACLAMVLNSADLGSPAGPEQ